MTTRKPKRPKSVEQHVLAAYADLPEMERRLADVVLDAPGDLALYSAKELAERAGVSQAAATRLFKRLGFRNFEEARRLARDAASWGSPVYMIPQRPQNPVGGDHRQSFVDEELRLIESTFQRLDRAMVAEAAAAIAAAPRILTFGFRNSWMLACYMNALLSQFRGGATLLPAGVETVAEHVSALEKSDLVIAVLMRRRVRFAREMMAAIRKSGASVLLITDPSAREILASADWTIQCDCATTDAFDSYSPAHAVIRFIALESMRKGGAASVRHMKKVEAAHDEIGDLG